MVCAERVRSPSCAGAKGFLRACITTGRRSFWVNVYVDGKKRLSGDTQRQATSGEVTKLKHETRDLKEALAETLLENRLLKKSMIADGDDPE